MFLVWVTRMHVTFLDNDAGRSCVVNKTCCVLGSALHVHYNIPQLYVTCWPDSSFLFEYKRRTLTNHTGSCCPTNPSAHPLQAAHSDSGMWQKHVLCSIRWHALCRMQKINTLRFTRFNSLGCACHHFGHCQRLGRLELTHLAPVAWRRHAIR